MKNFKIQGDLWSKSLESKNLNMLRLYKNLNIRKFVKALES